MSQRITASLGPSIIIAAAIVGTGELIVAPRLGATVGMSALWLIIVGCLVKVFLQEELGRHTILTGETTLQAFNRVPGPRWRLSWATWAWMLLLVGGTVQMGGILASLVQTLQLARVPGAGWLLAALLTLGTATILIIGRYGLIEKTSGILVAAFTLMTIVALVLLQRTEFAVTLPQIAEGLKFRLPESGFADAVAVFGITGIGTSELLFYPYWCLEKGYASDMKSGVARDPNLLRARVRGMRVDITVALVVYTFSTIAFFILGAAILHGGEVPQGLGMIQSLSAMYTAVFGGWVFQLFVIGAFVVLFSTFFVSMATWARLCADTARLSAKNPQKMESRRLTNLFICILAVLYLVLCLFFTATPQWLIVGGAMVQTILLPIFGVAILLIRRTRVDPFRPRRWFDASLYLSMGIITLAASYSIWGMILKFR